MTIANGQNGQNVEPEPESTSCYNAEMPPESILGAEEASEALLNNLMVECNELHSEQSLKWQINRIVDWALRIPNFSDLRNHDQSLLIHSGWNELILADVAFRSTRETLMLWPERPMERAEAIRLGCEVMFERILREMASKMRQLVMDRMELGALRAIILFNPDVNGLQSATMVDAHREKVYGCLEEYCKQQNPNEQQRFAKLLLRMPVLRSLSIRLMESRQLIVSAPPIQQIVEAIHQHQQQQQQPSTVLLVRPLL